MQSDSNTLGPIVNLEPISQQRSISFFLGREVDRLHQQAYFEVCLTESQRVMRSEVDRVARRQAGFAEFLAGPKQQLEVIKQEFSRISALHNQTIAALKGDVDYWSTFDLPPLPAIAAPATSFVREAVETASAISLPPSASLPTGALDGRSIVLRKTPVPCPRSALDLGPGDVRFELNPCVQAEAPIEEFALMESDRQLVGEMMQQFSELLERQDISLLRQFLLAPARTLRERRLRDLAFDRAVLDRVQARSASDTGKRIDGSTLAEARQNGSGRPEVSTKRNFLAANEAKSKRSVRTRVFAFLDRHVAAGGKANDDGLKHVARNACPKAGGELADPRHIRECFTEWLNDHKTLQHS